MARIRTIKPEFFRNLQLFNAEKESGLPLRTAFPGLWTCADREGRFKWRPEELKLDVLPFDVIDFRAVMDALEDGDWIRSYEANGQRYGYIPSWNDHQAINTRESKSTLPPPPEGLSPRVGRCVRGDLRDLIFTRDGKKCARCPSVEYLTIDHIFPRSIGGTDAPTNLRVLCRPCNSARPVADQGLLDDLARDGFTLDDMQRICGALPLHAHAHARHGNAQGEGEGKGKGREEEGKDAPTAGAGGPNGAAAFALEPINGKPKALKITSPIRLKTFFEKCEEAHQDPIPEDDSVFGYATKTGIPHEWLHLAWKVFRSKHIDRDKRYTDWRKAFRNCVEDNWYKLWTVDTANQFVMTGAGRQALKAHGK